MIPKNSLFRGILLVEYLCLYSYIIVIIISNSNKLSINSDFRSFVTGGAIVAQGMGDQLYDLNLQRVVQSELIGRGLELKVALPYLYPPFAALLFVPFTYIQIERAYVLYTLICLSLLYLLPIIIGQSFFKSHNRIVPFLIVIFPLCLHSVFLGQTSLVLFLILTGVFGLIKRKNYTKAGFLAGLIMVKPQYVILVPYLIFLLILVDNRISKKKIFIFLRSFAVVLIFFFITSLLISGKGVINYIGFLRITDSPNYGYFHAYGFTFHSYVSTFVDNNYFWPKMIANLVVYILLLLLFSLRLEKLNFGIAVSVIVLFTLYTSVHTVDALLVFIPIVFMVDEILFSKARQKVKYVVLIFLLIVASFNLIVPIPVHRSFLILFVGMILVFTDTRVGREKKLT